MRTAEAGHVEEREKETDVGGIVRAPIPALTEDATPKESVTQTALESLELTEASREHALLANTSDPQKQPSDDLVRIRQRKLVEAAQEGDMRAFEKLIKLKKRDILYLAMRFSSPEEAEDLAQEAMVNVYRYINDLKDPSKFNAWMFGVVRSVCYNAMNKKTKDKAISMDPTEEGLVAVEESRSELLPSRFMEDAEQQRTVVRALSSLPRAMRECLLLYYYEGLSYNEISETLRINSKKVANQLLRGKNMLRSKLIKENPELQNVALFDDYEVQTKSGVASVALPVASSSFFAQALQADAARAITPEMCETFVSRLHETLALSAAATSATLGGAAITTPGLGGTAGSAATATEAGGSFTTAAATGTGGTATAKIAAVALTFLLVGGGCGLYLAANRAQGETSLPTQEVPATSKQDKTEEKEVETSLPVPAPTTEPQPTVQPETLATQPEQIVIPLDTTETEAPINTLEDMIGVGEADALNAFTVYMVFYDSWDIFLGDIEAEYIGATYENDGCLYSLYQLDRQDKRLLLYTQDDGHGAVAVRYQFGTQAALPQPKMIQIMDMF